MYVCTLAMVREYTFTFIHAIRQQQYTFHACQLAEINTRFERKRERVLKSTRIRKYRQLIWSAGTVVIISGVRVQGACFRSWSTSIVFLARVRQRTRHADLRYGAQFVYECLVECVERYSFYAMECLSRRCSVCDSYLLVYFSYLALSFHLYFNPIFM